MLSVAKCVALELRVWGIQVKRLADGFHVTVISKDSKWLPGYWPTRDDS